MTDDIKPVPIILGAYAYTKEQSDVYLERYRYPHPDDARSITLDIDTIQVLIVDSHYANHVMRLLDMLREAKRDAVLFAIRCKRADEVIEELKAQIAESAKIEEMLE